MKASSISTFAINQAMRYQMMRLQVDLARNDKELSSGRVADRGLALGVRTGFSVALSRDVDRLENIKASNGLVQLRLTATQESLGTANGAAQSFLATTTTALTDTVKPSIVAQEARSLLNTLHATMNAQVDGAYVFAGTNTDVQPLADFTDPASTARQDFEAFFQASFGFGTSDPQTAAITGAEMTQFIGDYAAHLEGAGWLEWSTASDETVVSRVSLNETIETSVSANEVSIRRLAAATGATLAMIELPLGNEAENALLASVVAITGDASAEVTEIQARIGIVEGRVAASNGRIDTQIDMFKKSQLDLTGVDPYEASTRITALLTQIEISYSMTARMQQLTLLNYMS